MCVLGILLLVLAAALAAPARAWASSPHLTYSGSDTCATCHVPHQAVTSQGIFRYWTAEAGELPVCYSCHDGTGSTTNVKNGPVDSFSLASGHVLEGLVDTSTAGDLTNACSGCHTAHGDYSARPRLPARTVNGVAVAGTGNAWCTACHNASQDWYAKKGTYPSLSSPSRDASGYPTAGTFAGPAVYNDSSKNPHALIPAASGATTRTAGDCLYCHTAHRSAAKYDALVATLTPSVAGTVVSDRSTGNYAGLCFKCHAGGTWQASGAFNIKQFVTFGAADTFIGQSAGHRVKSAGATLPVDAPLPCYDCHNPHGSSRGNKRLLSDGIGASLDTSAGPAAVRKVCLSCHTTSDGLGWSSASSAYAAPAATATVEGLNRLGGPAGSGPAGAVGGGPDAQNWLRLRVSNGHLSTDTSMSCYDCHGSSYASAASKNVHDPQMYDASTHTSSNGYDFISAGIEWDGHSLGDGTYTYCSDCHTMALLPLHANYCQACHGADAPAAVKGAVASHNTSCTTCHPGQHYGTISAHDSNGYSECGPCHGNGCNQCHPAWTPVPAPATTSDAVGSYIADATIHFSATDGVYGALGIKATYYILDGAAAVAGSQVVVPQPASGTQSHTLVFWSTDWTGNTETAHTANFTVTHDSFPPVTTSNIVANKMYTGPHTFTLTAVDANSTVAGTWWQLDGTAGAWTAGTSVPVPGPSAAPVSHRLYFYSADSQANTETVKSVDFNVEPGMEYLSTGAIQTFVVPSGVATVGVTLNGGAGGDDYYASLYGIQYGIGGLGGRVTTVLNVTPGETLTIYAGGLGASNYYPSPGGWSNGGAANLYLGGGGGGSSSIWRGAAELAEAGGGGGAGYYYAPQNGGPGGAQGTAGGGFQTGGTASTYYYTGGGGGGWNAGAAGAAIYRPGAGGTSYIVGGSGTLTAGVNAGPGSVLIRYGGPGNTLTYIAGANGTISGVSPQVVANGGSGTPVTPVPNTGYHFVNWSDGSTANPRTDTNVMADKTVTATFALNQYTLTYTAGANGSVTGTATQTVNHGSSGTPVTAVATGGYHFVNWSDGSTANPRTDTNVTASKSVTANFAVNGVYTLTYTAGANGTISGVSPQTVSYLDSGTQVTAVPNTGYHFTTWSDGNAVNPRRDMSVSSTITVTANFAINTYTLAYTAGAGGTITGTTPQTVDYNTSGTSVTASPNTGYHFVDWSDGSTANPRTDANVVANKSVTANFALNTYTLTYAAGANGSISGTTPQTVNHGASGTAITATGNSGYHFVNWSDGSTANPRTDTNVTASKSVTANFAVNGVYTLTYIAGANGTISGTSPQSVAYLGSGTAVTAVPNTGYHFVNWSDGSTTNPRTDTLIAADKTVTAAFALNTYTITSSYFSGGTIAPFGTATVNYGDSKSYTGNPNSGYRLAYFYVDSVYQLPAAPYTFTNVSANHTIYAGFAGSGTRTLLYNAFWPQGYISGASVQTPLLNASGTAVTAGNYPGYHFVQWSDGNTNATRTDVATTDKIFTVVWAPNTYTITYTSRANGHLTGTLSQTGPYTSTGTPVTAVADAGYHFIGWSDGSTANPRTDTISGDTTVEAWYGADGTYTLTFAGDGNGYVSGDVIQAVAPGGSSAPVQAIAYDSANYTFSYWYDGATIVYDNPMTVTNVTKNNAWTAYFSYTGSCPFLFTWDGLHYRFEADEFAAGKLALQTSKGYRKPNPLDYHVLATTPASKDGALEYKLVEERDETDYLDQVKLYTVDAPADRDVYVERSQAEGVGQFTTLAKVIHTTAKDLQPPPSVVWVNTGQNVTSKIAKSDKDYVVLNNDRNVGFNYQTLELDLGDVQSAPQTKLVIDGRTLIPSSPEGRAYSRQFGPQVKFEVQDSSGNWVAVPTTNTILPKPPEFTRPFVLDLSKIWISNSRHVRLSYLYKTYIDSILLDTTADAPVTITELPLLSADLQAHGFDFRTGSGELYDYVYGIPFAQPRYKLPGNYTRFGDVTPLLGAIDDKFVIFGGGDELTLRFATPTDDPANITRRYLFLSDGYYKDLKENIPHTVEPLPFAAMSNFPYSSPEQYPTDVDHQKYLSDWNTRREGY